MPKTVIVVTNPTPEQMETTAMLCAQPGWPAPPVFVAFEKELSLRTVKSRYPQKGLRQVRIRAETFGVLDKPPGMDEKHFTGKKPIRGSDYSNEGDEPEN